MSHSIRPEPWAPVARLLSGLALAFAAAAAGAQTITLRVHHFLPAGSTAH